MDNPVQHVSRRERFRRWLFGWCEKHQCYEEADMFHTTVCPLCREETDKEHVRKWQEEQAEKRAARVQEIREGVYLALHDYHTSGLK